MKQNKLSRVHSTDWKSSLISGEIYAQISKKNPCVQFILKLVWENGEDKKGYEC